MKRKTRANRDNGTLFGYTDLFFDKGHYLLKVKQVMSALIGWTFFIIPTYITVVSYLYFISDKHVGWKIWSYLEGIELINTLIVIGLFAAFMTLIYTVTMTIIQNNRRESFVEKWPTFSTVVSIERQQRANEFMAKRFGDEEFRQTVRYYDVTPDKNLSNGELSRIINNEGQNN